jgi:hypothetical protein
MRGHEFTAKEAAGIDAIVAWFRTRREEQAIGASRYEIEYFRRNQPIGNEVFIGYWMPQELTYLRRDSGIAAEELRAHFDRLALQSSLTGAELDRMFPFEQLEPSQFEREELSDR